MSWFDSIRFDSIGFDWIGSAQKSRYKIQVIKTINSPIELAVIFWQYFMLLFFPNIDKIDTTNNKINYRKKT